MTKEEKIELIKKLNTQIDGCEAYVRQLKTGESGTPLGFLKNIEGYINTLRTQVDFYEEWGLNYKGG